jgi:RHS repeat-associated protein
MRAAQGLPSNMTHSGDVFTSRRLRLPAYAYDGDNLVEETNATGAVVARCEQTQNIDEPLAILRSAATSYYHADGLGSVTSLSNGAGSITNTYTYDSFGKLTASTGSLVNPFRYTARESDTETGLYYYRAKYYDGQQPIWSCSHLPGPSGGRRWCSAPRTRRVLQPEPVRADLAKCFGQTGRP